MARHLTFQAKAFLLALLFIILWTIAPSFLKRLTTTAFEEFQAPAWTGLSYMRDIHSYWGSRMHSKGALIEGGIDLSRLNAAYALRNQQADVMEAEIRRLESLFALPSHTQFRYEIARVVRRDITSWWQSLTIRKGLADGIAPGQAVVFAGGVVGQIDKVYAYTSTVKLISSPNFRTAAHFEGDPRPVEFRGGNNPGLQFASASVYTVPADLEASLKNPLRLTSSRLGGAFPDGLTLGWVHRLELGADALFQNGTVRLDSRLQSLREVAVLIPLQPRDSADQ